LGAPSYCLFADFAVGLASIIAENGRFRRERDEADIVLVQGLPPDSDYRFKHALIQDAAYENLLKSRRQALHGRTADTAAAEPELLAHHLTRAGLTEAAIEWWGKAGQRSLESSALVEAVEQLTRALDQIATLPTTPTLRREQIGSHETLGADVFAVDQAGPHREASDRLDDLGEAVGEIEAVPRIEPYTAAVAPRHDAEAVVFDLVHPARLGRRLGRGTRQAWLDEAGQRTRARTGGIGSYLPPAPSEAESATGRSSPGQDVDGDAPPHRG
jgi:hypothetical protein